MGNESRPAVLAADSSRQSIDSLLHGQRSAIERWFETRWAEVPPPFYASMDLRHAGFKLAPIDTNLFPAGFNNLAPEFWPACARAIRAEVGKRCNSMRRVVLVPENHTRNLYYYENLAALTDILRVAELDVRIGSLLPDLDGAREITLPSGRTLVLEPLTRHGERVRIGGFDPCFILLNNDLSAGRPALLEGLAQPVVPPLALGWSSRSKTNHFIHYRQVATEFADLVGIDPWLIDPIFRNCGEIDFQKRAGEECLVTFVDEVLGAVARKYAEHGIAQEPYVVIKADAGTYGMAIMTVGSVDQVRELNRKQRTRMAHTKEGRAVTRVLVQEGVPTHETRGTAAAEPVIYTVGPSVVGGFYRVHESRGPMENLNSPGMRFEPMDETDTDPAAASPRLYACGAVARLALLAAARELKEVSP